MKCPKCQFENIEGVKFCNECGAKLELICSKCGSANPPDSKFCNECGHDLAAPTPQSTPQPAPKELSFEEKLDKIQRYLPDGLTEKILAQRGKIEGERKQVTVMFCDMEGYTALSEKLGPEEAYSLMDDVYELLIHSVHEYGGTVNELTGDGIMALFGAPIAQEDAPQRAIRSALAMHREMVKFSDSRRGGARSAQDTPPMRMRVGIHTGPVVLGTVGNDLRVEFKAVGDTVNLASRMEGLAEPGTTYVTEDTYKLTEGLFRFDAIGALEVKGKKHPVKTYRALASSTRRTRFDVSAERGLTPFTGRDRDLEMLLDSYHQARGGRGQVISITAEAGVGKSRLLYEFRKEVANEDVTFLEGRCLSYSSGITYHPIRDLWKSNFDISESDEDSTIRDKVTEGIKGLGVDETSFLPYFLELLSIKDSGIDASMSPEVKRRKIMEALKLIIIKSSETRLLIMAVEDLHWCDPTSEEVFKDLFNSISGANVLLILTYRPEFIHAWGGKSYHNQLNLNRLSNRESLNMITYLMGTDNIESSVEEMILEKTEGVPFFIEEFVKSLIELKIIEKKEDRYTISKDVLAMAVPSTIQDVVMARVDSLPDDVKTILQMGSVIEREFDYNLIKMVSGLPEVELLSHLSALKDTELLYERGVIPQSTYIFKHALTQRVVYDSILGKRKKKIHAKIGIALEEIHGDNLQEYYEILAYHYSETDLQEQAVAYWQKAGEKAANQSANMEAISHLSKGLESLQALPDTPQRSQQELTFLTILGPALMATKGFAAPEVEKVYTRARELCDLVEESSQLFEVYWGLWLFHLVRADFPSARELGNQLLDLARRLQKQDLLLQAHHALWTVLFYLGEPVPAQSHLDQGLMLYDPHHYRSGSYPHGGHDPGVCCRVFASQNQWLLGYQDKALDLINDALALAQKISHPFSHVQALICASAVHKLRREGLEAQKRAEEAMELSSENGFPHWLAMGTMLKGWALADQGQVEEGISLMQEGLSAHKATGAEQGRSNLLAMLADVYGKMGNAEEGLALLDEALVFIDKNGERLYEAELYHLKGKLLLSKTSPDEGMAEGNFLKALEISSRQQARSLELRSTVSLCHIWLQQSKLDQARKLLTEIYNWFTEGFDTTDLIEAKALLEELS